MPDEDAAHRVDGRALQCQRRSATPAKAARWTFVYAPGAGSNIHDPFGAYAARELAPRGVRTVRFQFPYMEAGRTSPDRPPSLEATWRAVIDAVARPQDAPRRRRPLDGRAHRVDGRRAGRAASMRSRSSPTRCIRPASPSSSRTSTSPPIKRPTLFVSGTNDAFGSPDELRAAARSSSARSCICSTARTTASPSPSPAAARAKTFGPKRSTAFVEWLARDRA